MGWIYFLQARRQRSQRIKIGRSEHCPYRRLRQLRSRHLEYSHYELLGGIATSAPVRDELALKHRFAHLQDKGEFYRPDKGLHDFIRENAQIHICTRRCFIQTVEERRAQERSEEFSRFLNREIAKNVAAYNRRARAMERKAQITASRSPKT